MNMLQNLQPLQNSTESLRKKSSQQLGMMSSLRETMSKNNLLSEASKVMRSQLNAAKNK